MGKGLGEYDKERGHYSCSSALSGMGGTGWMEFRKVVPLESRPLTSSHNVSVQEGFSYLFGFRDVALCL